MFVFFNRIICVINNCSEMGECKNAIKLLSINDCLVAEYMPVYFSWLKNVLFCIDKVVL